MKIFEDIQEDTMKIFEDIRELEVKVERLRMEENSRRVYVDMEIGSLLGRVGSIETKLNLLLDRLNLEVVTVPSQPEKVVLQKKKKK